MALGGAAAPPMLPPDLFSQPGSASPAAAMGLSSAGSAPVPASAPAAPAPAAASPSALPGVSPMTPLILLLLPAHSV
jgi:hypothetical protein